MDIINSLSLNENTDEKHRIYFTRDGGIDSLSLAELDRRAVRVAQHFGSMGIRKGDQIGVMAKNSIEWVLADLAAIKLGGIVGGFDPIKFEVAAIMERYDIRLAVVEERVDLPGAVPLSQIWEWGCSAEEMPRLRSHGGYGPDEPFAIKFTSGSTGPPKGMHALSAGVNDSISAVQEMFAHGDKDNILIFLRLAYLQQRYWIYSAMAFGHDVTLTTLGSVLPMAQACHPTVIMGVPGLFEDLKRTLDAAWGAELNILPVRREKIQGALGGCVRYLWTGSAPAGRTTLDFYDECGVPIYQGYGLNETCIISKNCPGANRTGSVGRILRHKSVRFDERGVLIVRSCNPIARGYTWCGPGDNERMFLSSGEIYTNDVGHLDQDGYLYILGRADDMIVLSTGFNIMVDPVEQRLKEHRGIPQCILYGHGKPFLVVLISPTECSDRDDIEKHIEAVNATLFPEQRVRGAVISPEPFSIENGLLTTQFKPLRKRIHQRFAKELDEVYEQTAERFLWKGIY
jgi:long-chain acyl-CoA synthetase